MCAMVTRSANRVKGNYTASVTKKQKRLFSCPANMPMNPPLWRYSIQQQGRKTGERERRPRAFASRREARSTRRNASAVVPAVRLLGLVFPPLPPGGPRPRGPAGRAAARWGPQQVQPPPRLQRELRRCPVAQRTHLLTI